MDFAIKMLQHFQEKSMRPLEIVIPILLALYLVSQPHRSMIVRLIPLAALVLTMFHLVLEGYRWQMAPVYVLVAFLSLHVLSIRPASPGWGSLASSLMLILLAVSTALPILLPVPSIPTPGGPYPVGTRTYELTDNARQELYSGKEEARRFQIQLWYPAEVSPSDERAPWMTRAEVYAPAIAAYIHMPAFFLDHLALVKLPAYNEARIASPEAQYPIILFSHGWNGFNAQNSGQAIELASQGYIVVGLQHTYGAVITVFSDGKIAPNNPTALPSGAPDEEYGAAAQKLGEQWAGDIGYALDFLEAQNADAGSPFHTAIDLSRVGVYGHSTGGGAAIQFCGTDPRCKALLGMDPFMRPVSTEVVENGVSQPSFFMFSQRWADDADSRNNQLFKKLLLNAPHSLGAISIDGTEHYDFSDLPSLSPLAPRLGLKGPINGKRVTLIINDYLLSFFDMTLKEAPMTLFDGQNQKYNEVKFSH
jgi:predicted dienelactone hydrolase